ncbi:hypothetical protein ALNOE001_01630 [Candidatus Methanobinarius endosymbioticus]|uniref:Uncharacterized protein n=1 Tax=Candidatus Methanobinarius endosymbioticus TaxID=2006182 RepID=A0A366ME21_9EURY|nr:hypothetical protein ALNOE001_01630 [Candidatus Methanobinarius endosymbioticus]
MICLLDNANRTLITNNLIKNNTIKNNSIYNNSGSGISLNRLVHSTI